MRRPYTLAIFAAVFIGGCSRTENDIVPQRSYFGPSRVLITESLRDAVRRGVGSRISTPRSFKIGTLRAGQRYQFGSYETVVCGTVAASNRGVTRTHTFIGIYDPGSEQFDIVAIGDQSPRADVMIANSCRMEGLSL